MCKQVLTILLFTAFAVQTFSSGLIWFNYYSNTRAFAKNCENKTRPALHCNGKCQAMKKIQQQEKKEQQNGERKSENKLQVLSSKSFFYCYPDIASPAIVKAVNVEKTAPLTDISYSFFHPPQA
jgi:hypothetical protein